MNIRGEIRELRRKLMPGSITTNPCRQPTLTDHHQDQEDVRRNRAVAAWLTLMKSDRPQSCGATPSLTNYTTAFGMDYEPPRSRLSVTGVTSLRMSRQRGNRQEPRQHPIEVSPVTTASEHLPLLASMASPKSSARTSEKLEPQPFKSTVTVPLGANDDELAARQSAVPVTNALPGGIDKAIPNLHGCDSSSGVQPPLPISEDVSPVAPRLPDQPVVEPTAGKLSHRPKIIAVRSYHRAKQLGEGDNTFSRAKDKVKDKDENTRKQDVSRDKNKRSDSGKPESYRVRLPKAHTNKAASHAQPQGRQRDIKAAAAAACRLHQRYKLHHENILLHPTTTALLSSPKSSSLHLDLPHRSLKHCLAKHPSDFDEPLISSLTRQVLLGLVYLHRRGITHRNIRTSTVFIGPNGTCKLGGLHHATHRDDASNKNRYSPHVAPETLALQESTATSKLDIWDLGILVLEMLGPSGCWRKHDVIRALLLEPMDGGVLLLEKVDGEKMSVHARLFLTDCLQVPFRRSTAEALLSEHEFCNLDDTYDFGQTILGRSLRGQQSRTDDGQCFV
ncbi:hypothetical protein E4U43_003314 [Claviceps pusilla]|uniref:mitogen-activated protein kinase n=1 Tax=Claviceps pusilla TaxID=123648 RepID=A0A9P7N668_9HYPO|nr:hypothetical protein E4U43_003314 [Claviceps pusilla]